MLNTPFEALHDMHNTLWFRDVHVFVTYWSSHVAGARACPGRRLTAHAHYIRDIMIPCYDHQLVEIVRAALAETHLRFGKDYKSAGSHSRYTRGGVYRSPKGAPRYV